MTFVVQVRRTLRHAILNPRCRTTKLHSSRLRHAILLTSFVITVFLYNARSSINLSSHTLETVVRTAAFRSLHPVQLHSPSTSDQLRPPTANSKPPIPSIHTDAYEPLPSQVDAIVGEGHSAKKVLVDVYALPIQVVSNMTQAVATRLYWKLVYTDVIRALHQTPTTTLRATPQLTPRATVLFVHAQNGLGNRLRSLASGMAIARATQRVPVIVWQKDAHLGASLKDLFRVDTAGTDINTVLYKDLIVMEDFPHWSTISDRNAHWRPYNYMQKDGAGAQNDVQMRFELPQDPNAFSPPPATTVSSDTLHAVIAATPQPIAKMPSSPQSARYIVQQHEHVYFKSAYVANVWPEKLSSPSIVNSELRALVPSENVLRIVNALDHRKLRHSYGVHIRSRTLANDNVAVESGCEYTRLGAYTTDYWRARSQLPVFISKMRQKIQFRKDATFFIATDDKSITKSLEKEFPGRLVNIERDCDGRDADCVVFAMADLLCLAKTRRLYGSNWSSFSEVAGRLSNRRLFLSGRDFGKPRRLPKFLRVLSSLPNMSRKWWLGLFHPYSACNQAY